MKSATPITVKNLRTAGGAPYESWVVAEVENGFLIRCGKSVLYSVNSGKPRLFKNLTTVLKILKEDIGVTKFEVETMK